MDDEIFVQKYELSIIVPEDTQTDINDLLSKYQALQLIPQRKVLFFDEILPIIIGLRTPIQEPEELKNITKRLSLSLELRAIGSSLSRSGPPHSLTETSPARLEDVVWKGTLVAQEEPIIVKNQAADNDYGGPCMTAIWEINAILNRPGIKMRAPMIGFYSSASLQLGVEEVSSAQVDPYLPSGLPAPENLLAPLQGATSQGKRTPSLSSLRLHRVQPFTDVGHEKPLDLTVNVPGAVQALPAVRGHIRQFGSRLGPGRSVLLAALDLEIAPFSEHELELRKLEVRLSGIIIPDLSQGLAPNLPLRCRSKDNIVLLYQLYPNSIGIVPSESTSSPTVNVVVDAHVMASDACRPTVRMNWNVAVNFPAAEGTSHSIPFNFMKRPSRPPAIAIAPSSTATQAVGEMDTTNLPGYGSKIPVNIRQMGISITFTGPSVTYVGKEFAWDVLVFNGSNKPRHISIATTSTTHAMSYDSIINNASSIARPNVNDEPLAEAVIEDRELLTSHKSGQLIDPDILVLAPKTQTAILDPGSCHNLQLKFAALSLGYFRSRPLRITDEQTGKYVDVRDLPSVFVEQESLD